MWTTTQIARQAAYFTNDSIPQSAGRMLPYVKSTCRAGGSGQARRDDGSSVQRLIARTYDGVRGSRIPRTGIDRVSGNARRGVYLGKYRMGKQNNCTPCHYQNIDDI